MTTQRILRSHSTLAVPRSPHGGPSCDKGNTAGSTAATATTTAVKKRPQPSRKSEEIPPSPSTKKRPRIQTPEPQQKALGKHSQDASEVSGHPLLEKADLPLDRPAEPHITNAPLITPRGSRLVTYSKGAVDVSPAKSGVPRPTTTTSHILDKACAHLVEMEPRLQPLIKQHYCRVFCPEGLAEVCDPFKSLCNSIMAQQVSGAAASSIKKKFVRLLSGPHDEEKADEAQAFPTPAQVAACDVPFLRQAGLSERKAEYIKGLAQKFASGELSAAMLLNASDEEVLEKLTAVRGLGKWSVEMFACFGLKRMDIFSTGDLGVQRGLAAFVGKDVKKLKAKGGGKWKYMSEQDMLKHSVKFAPYRSIFMWYMWRVEDVDISVVQEA